MNSLDQSNVERQMRTQRVTDAAGRLKRVTVTDASCVEEPLMIISPNLCMKKKNS